MMASTRKILNKVEKCPHTKGLQEDNDGIDTWLIRKHTIHWDKDVIIKTHQSEG
jgi:hypothetical protein